jgi:hypothetical protein
MADITPAESLYDTDVLTWSEHQAGLLRSVAEGERMSVAEGVAELGWRVGGSEGFSDPNCQTPPNGFFPITFWSDARTPYHFEPGDLVILRSGGPAMTIECYEQGQPLTNRPGWRVHWSIQGALRSATLPGEVLKP